MSTPARIGVFAAVAVAVIAAYFALSGGSSKTGTMTTGPRATTPAFRVIRAAVPVDAKGPVGGVKSVVAHAGDRIVVTVRSNGYTGEVHLHGFDVKHDVGANGTAVFSLSPHETSSPRALGVVGLELEDIAVQIARLEIRPS